MVRSSYESSYPRCCICGKRYNGSQKYHHVIKDRAFVQSLRDEWYTCDSCWSSNKEQISKDIEVFKEQVRRLGPTLTITVDNQLIITGNENITI